MILVNLRNKAVSKAYFVHFTNQLTDFYATCTPAIPITGCGGPWSCETSRLPHSLDSRLTDGSETVSLKRRPPVTLHEDFWYSFLLEAESIPGP
jgi:hypothetical protein